MSIVLRMIDSVLLRRIERTRRVRHHRGRPRRVIPLGLLATSARRPGRCCLAATARYLA